MLNIELIFNKFNLDAILVTDVYTMRYLSKYMGDTGKLYFSRGRNVLLTDSRYTTQAREEGVGCEVVQVGTENTYGYWLEMFLKEENIRRIGFEDQSILHKEYMEYQKLVPGVEWIPLGKELEHLRMVKSGEELARIREAARIADQAFEHILEVIRPGMSELQVAAQLEYDLKCGGASGLSFDTIVASGKNSAKPHATPTAKLLEPGDFVTMDFGCIYQGYCSDMTRTIVMGKASPRQREIYNVVLEAQRAALSVLKAGVTGRDVDQVARAVISGHGYGEWFGHSLGHGVGLFIHEEPTLSAREERLLEENMVETVEPGIYIPEFGGVRIEDLVAVKTGGCENFTASCKELIEL